MNIIGSARTAWRNLLYSGLDDDPQSPHMRRIKFTNLFAIISIVALYAVALANYIDTKMISVAVELAFGTFGIYIMIYLRRTHDITRAQTMGMVDLVVVLSYGFISGGIGNTGIVWLYTMPSAAFFLMGRRWGWLWLAIVGVEFTTMIVIAAGHLMSTPYSLIMLLVSFTCFIMVSLIISNFERIRDDYEKVIAVKTRELIVEIVERKRVEVENVKLITDLQTALFSIKTLKGLVPICASCKKIRDDKGYWQQVEEYVSKNTEAEFSHSLCDECAHKLYPEYFTDKKNLERTVDQETKT